MSQIQHFHDCIFEGSHVHQIFVDFMHIFYVCGCTCMLHGQRYQSITSSNIQLITSGESKSSITCHNPLLWLYSLKKKSVISLNKVRTILKLLQGLQLVMSKFAIITCKHQMELFTCIQLFKQAQDLQTQMFASKNLRCYIYLIMKTALKNLYKAIQYICCMLHLTCLSASTMDVCMYTGILCCIYNVQTYQHCYANSPFSAL